MVLSWATGGKNELRGTQRGKELFGLGLTELIIILLIVFFLFGGRKLPEISRALGLSIRNFKKGLHEPDAIDITPKKDKTKPPGEDPQQKP